MGLYRHLGVSIVMGVPKNGWCILENAIKRDDGPGYPYDYGNPHLICTFQWLDFHDSMNRGLMAQNPPPISFTVRKKTHGPWVSCAHNSIFWYSIRQNGTLGKCGSVYTFEHSFLGGSQVSFVNPCLMWHANNWHPGMTTFFLEGENRVVVLGTRQIEK